MAGKSMHSYIFAGVRCKSLMETIHMSPTNGKTSQSLTLKHNDKSAALQGLPSKKDNSRPYIAFLGRSRCKILVTAQMSVLYISSDG